MKEGSVEMSAFLIIKMFESEINVKRSVLDFILRTYKKSTDEHYKDHLKQVFWHVIDNYVENIPTLYGE